MFSEACRKNRESIYGVRGFVQIKNQLIGQLGSGFAIAPGILATAAHLVHLNANPKKARFSNFEVIRSPDIGQNMEQASLIAEHPTHDIALLKITTPRSLKFLNLEPNKVPTGTSCGSLGFPLGEQIGTSQGIRINLAERFQGSYISAFRKALSSSGNIVDYYEIDSLMYNGSSGCPGFLINSDVIGMQSQSLLGNSAADNSRNAHVRGFKGGKKPVASSQLAISMWVPSMDIISFARDNNVL